MTTPALHPDAIRAKYATLKHWRDISATGRRAHLRNWKVSRLEDGRFHVSARICGRDAAVALRAFANRQALFLSQRMGPDTGDMMPSLDVSQPGRTAACWRLSGVWVEVWHPDTPLGPPEPVPVPPPPGVLIPGPGGRLPYTRRKKETPTA